MTNEKAGDRSIYTSAKPLFRVSQILGLAPVSWPTLKPSRCGTAYSCTVFLAFLAWFIYTTCLAVEHDYPGKVATYVVPDLLNSGALYLASLASLALGVTVMRRKPEVILRLLAQADQVVCPSSVHKRAQYVVILQIGVLMVTLTVLAAFDNWVWTGKLWNLHDYTGRYLAHLINAVVMLQFSNLALVLRHRFRKLNSVLQSEDMFYDVIPNPCSAKHEKLHNATLPAFETRLAPATANVLFGPPLTVQPVKSSKDECCEYNKNIFALRRVHAMLCDVASMVNEMFGVQMLLALASEFIGIIWLLYLTLVATIESERSESSLKRLCLSVSWIMYRSIKVLYVVSSCHVAQTEAQLTGVLVHRVLLHKEALREPGIVQLQLFSQQLMHSRHQVDFSACGLFSLNMTLLHSIISAVTTYIIILMQFHEK